MPTEISDNTNSDAGIILLTGVGGFWYGFSLGIDIMLGVISNKKVKSLFIGRDQSQSLMSSLHDRLFCEKCGCHKSLHENNDCLNCGRYCK